MRVLLFDTETTSLEPATGQVIELAAQVYDTKHASVIASYAELVYAEANPAEHVNRICAGLLKELPAQGAHWGTVEYLYERYLCKYVIAHNADFDMQWSTGFLKNLPWSDTCYGITWPKQSREGSSLINLMLDHGLAVVDPHRALNDTMMLARLLTRCAELGSDLDVMIEKGARPRAEYAAKVSYAQNHLAKVAGFHWKPDSKLWVRKLVIEDALMAVEKYGFEVERIMK